MRAVQACPAAAGARQKVEVAAGSAVLTSHGCKLMGVTYRRDRDWQNDEQKAEMKVELADNAGQRRLQAILVALSIGCHPPSI